MRNILFPTILAITLLSGCALKKATQPQPEQTVFNKAQRNAHVQQLNQWTIKGKIAYITKKDRQSASLHWQFNAPEQSQQLNLTTYLGINVLSLHSQLGLHTVSVDGDEYQSENLDELITALTGWTIPTKAMDHWLKGLVYNSNDIITYDPATELPLKLTSLYDDKIWQIDYGNYQQVGQVQLAKKFTIKQNGLVIKIMINRWKL